MTAQHWIRDDPMPNNGRGRKIITHCGREGYADTADEFVTVKSDRFEAYERLGAVTCKRCLKSAERISKSPWGCKRDSRMRASPAGPHILSRNDHENGDSFMPMFKKKPIEVEARLFDGIPAGAEIWDWADGAIAICSHNDASGRIPYLEIETLEGTMIANLGDWIIKGVNGEFYPCKPGIFAASYDAVGT